MFVLVIAIVVAGYLLIESIWSNEPASFNDCIEMGYPIIVDDRNQQQCIINGRALIKEDG